MAECSVLGANNMTNVARIILGLLNTFTSITATFGNLLIVIVIIYFKSLRRRSNFLIICLAITDLSVGALLQPMASAQLFNADIGKDCLTAYATTYLGAMLCGASSWILTLISYDRYLHLVKLQNYNLYMTKKKFLLMSAFCWIFPICLGFLMFSDLTLDVYYGILVLSANFNIIVIAVSYRQSYKFIKEKSKIFPGTSVANKDSREESKKMNHHWKLAKTFAMIIVCYLLCWTPMISFVVYLVIQRRARLSFGSFAPYLHTVYYITLLMGYSNSSMNPVIYFWRNRELKSAMKQFVLIVILRRSYSSDQGIVVSANSSSLQSESLT